MSLIGWRRFAAGCAFAVFALVLAPAELSANGLLENRPWQFDSGMDKANKAAVLDLIERKKGGYYDGFTTVVYSTTNVGTQVNCNNAANATGNIADNGQSGPSTASSGSPGVTADSTGNADTVSTSTGGATSGGSTSVDGSQSNAGSIDSSVSGSPINNGVSGTQNGDTVQDLSNVQDNSGTQDAGVANSVACQMDGAVFTGNVDAPVTGPLN